ncbi:hypothetical protein B0H13DRAFT_2312232 [Mycena leptocephala]|nr:hypothetical protein B0H13DRAFT_2312232 [Mycena leptocephala]
MRPRWCLPFFFLAVSAVQRNHTIDDTDPLVHYLEEGFACRGCDDSASADLVAYVGFSRNNLFNQTFSWIDSSSPLQFSFTGTALFIFIAVPAGIQLPSFLVSMDGESSTSETAGINASPVTQYNLLAYQNTSMSNGPHIFGMSSKSGDWFLDYAVYSTGDPDTVLSSVSSPEGLGGATASVGGGSSHTSTPQPLPSDTSNAKNNRSVVAIAVGIAAVIAVISVLVGVFLCSQARRRAALGSPTQQESGLPFPDEARDDSKAREGTPPAGVSAEADTAIVINAAESELTLTPVTVVREVPPPPPYSEGL